MIEYAVYYLIAINFITFAAFGWDKAQAESGGWRVPEKTLVFYVAIGGLIGALAGRKLFRHKTRKHGFSEKLWSGAVANVLMVGFGWYVVSSAPQPVGPEEQARIEAVMASAYYPGCDQVRAAGKAPLRYGEPGYRSHMDGDGDGIACEPHY